MKAPNKTRLRRLDTRKRLSHLAHLKHLAVMAIGLVITGSVIALLAQAPPAEDPLLKAMHDELERSRKLTLSSLEAPYFIEYLLDDSDNFSVSASLGGLVSRRRDKFRQPDVQV